MRYPHFPLSRSMTDRSQRGRLHHPSTIDPEAKPGTLSPVARCSFGQVPRANREASYLVQSAKVDTQEETPQPRWLGTPATRHLVRLLSAQLILRISLPFHLPCFAHPCVIGSEKPMNFTALVSSPLYCFGTCSSRHISFTSDAGFGGSSSSISSCASPAVCFATVVFSWPRAVFMHWRLLDEPSCGEVEVRWRRSSASQRRHLSRRAHSSRIFRPRNWLPAL